MTASCRRDAFGLSRAIYQTFVSPCLFSSSYSVKILPLRTSPVQLQLRTFYSSPSRLVARKPKPTEAPARRTQKYDNEITARMIRIVGEDGSLSQPLNTQRTLMSIDLKEQRLVQLTEQDVEYPICKIMSKKAIYEDAKKKREREKENRKAGRVSTSMKQIELNWAIDQGDLAHRMLKLKEFLIDGRKVEIILAAKKRGRAATPEECKNVLSTIKETAEAVPGAIIRKELEGPRGGFASMVIVGRIVEAPKKPNESMEIDSPAQA